MNNKQEKWMERLVKNYRIPDEVKTESKKTILNEVQKKIIMGKS